MPLFVFEFFAAPDEFDEVVGEPGREVSIVSPWECDVPVDSGVRRMGESEESEAMKLNEWVKE